MRISKQKANDILRTVSDGECFFSNDGKVFCGLEDLHRGLKEMSQDVCGYHCNKEKCDFSQWILNVLHDDKLAEDVLKSKGDLEKINKKIEKRIETLKKYI